MQQDKQNFKDRIHANAEKELFAEDFVYHVMYLFECFDYTRCQAARLRPFVKTTFTINVSNAILHLLYVLNSRINDDFCKLRDADMITKEGFEVYARSLAVSFVNYGLDPEGFLKFCVILSSVGVSYYNRGVEEAPEIAIAEIVKALMYDLCQGGWEVVEMTAQRHARMYFSLEGSLSPDPSDASDDSSHDEE